MKALIVSFFVSLSLAAGIANAAPPAKASTADGYYSVVTVNFTGKCKLWTGYDEAANAGLAAVDVRPGTRIVLDGSPTNVHGATHFNCQPTAGVDARHLTKAGWLLVPDGTSRPMVVYGTNVVSMPTQPQGLALWGAALTSLEQADKAVNYYSDE